MELEDLPLDVGELGVIISLLGLGIAFLLYKQLTGKNVENETVASIGEKIQSGAMAFLNAEYRILIIFVLVVAGLLFAGGQTNDDLGLEVSIAFLLLNKLIFLDIRFFLRISFKVKMTQQFDTES